MTVSDPHSAAGQNAGKTNTARALILRLSKTGMEYYWDSADGLEGPFPSQTSAELWNKGNDNDNPSRETLQLIQSAVYEHDEILDDCQATVIVDTDKVLFFPSDMDEDEIVRTACKVFGTDEEELLIENTDAETAVYFLTKGLEPFLSRTFPGARITHPLSLLKSMFASDTHNDDRVYADIDNHSMRLLAFKGKNLRHASVHNTPAASDAVYYIFSLWNLLGFYADEGEVNVSGDRNFRQELTPMLRRHLNYVATTLLPPTPFTEKVPTDVLLAAKYSTAESNPGTL